MSKQAQNPDTGEKDLNRSLRDINWEFPSADTQYLTHGLHTYPARMIPQIPSILLKHFIRRGDISEGDWLYDPFSGSGTTAVEARLHNLNSISNDINPLACMLTRAKATVVSPQRIKKAKKALLHNSDFNNSLQCQLAKIRWKYTNEIKIDNSNANLNEQYEWFPEPQLQQLSCIREEIDRLESEFGRDIARVFRVSLSKTSREVSYQRNGEYKRYRMGPQERKSHFPDVLSIFSDELDKNIGEIEDYCKIADEKYESEVYQVDSTEPYCVDNNSANIILTSPPYGDHDTTVAYGQFSQDPAIISSDQTEVEMKNVDKDGLGGQNDKDWSRPKDKIREISTSLDETIGLLEEKDGRYKDALEFFNDYFDVLLQTKRILKHGSPSIFVVANRTMSRVNIPTHLITVEFYNHLNFEETHIIPRDIPSKTLPLENTPENITGKTGDLMAEEYILVFQSPDDE